MSSYGRCPYCLGDLVCPTCEEYVPTPENILDDLYTILLDELDDKLTKPELSKLYDRLGSLFI